MASSYQSWGRYFNADQQVVRVYDRSAPLPKVAGKALPYGNGRSYGDSCLNDGGTLLDARGLDRFISFDPETGVLECEAGVLFSTILELIVPQGWFLPVTPGTRFVTVGGAIANDVHGKNHHRAGSFGNHVLSLDLLRTDNSRITCSGEKNEELFNATIGGLGLTGFITRARLQLKRIRSAVMSGESIRFRSLQEFFDLSDVAEADNEYTVAWIDCTAQGPNLGRGIFNMANHAAPGHHASKRQGTRSVPFTSPVSLVNSVTLRPFNELYYRKQRERRVHVTSHYEPFFYPLDGIRNWNRLYGPAGFLQYQCVIPRDIATEVTTDLLLRISAAKEGSLLAVLKQFGDISSRGLLSFPRAGTTLALDFPNRGASTLRLLDALDDIVDEAGGAVYPAKDARMSAERFRRYFPNHATFLPFRDPGLSSGFWRRVME